MKNICATCYTIDYEHPVDRVGIQNTTHRKRIFVYAID